MNCPYLYRWKFLIRASISYVMIQLVTFEYKTSSGTANSWSGHIGIYETYFERFWKQAEDELGQAQP